MEDSNSSVAVATRSLYSTHTLAQLWHVQSAKWKSTSSLMVLIGGVVLLALVSYAALLSTPANVVVSAPFLSPRMRSSFTGGSHDDDQYERRRTEVFERAAMPNKTVIITTLNAAWGTMIDMFLDSFWHGDETRKLLQHLVIVCVDRKSYQRCRVIHPHCFYIQTHAVDFSTGEKLLGSADYNKLMWRRIKFLKTVLEMNYSFIFTDADVLWFRNPFPRLQSDTEADFQIACDRYNGRPWDLHNAPNAGFIYARANARTVRFYDFWYAERRRDWNLNDQEILNAIKFDGNFTSIGMKLRFLDTQFFGGFCAVETTDMSKAVTMHATCCKGLQAKLLDLRMMLEGWKKWHAQNILTSTTHENQQYSAVASSRNESASELQLPDLPSLHDVETAGLDPHFQLPFACPRLWHVV